MLHKADYFAVVWLNDNHLILNYKDDVEPYRKHLIQMQLDGSQIIELPQLSDSNCSEVESILYGLLPDGRAQIAEHCYPFFPRQGRGIIDEKLFLLGYESSSGKFSPIVSNSIYTPAMRLPISQISWNPTMERGMFGTGGGLYETLAWITDERYEDAPITIQDGARGWRLDELLHGDLGHPSPQLGNASWPAWSPDGKAIAFFASPQMIGVDGFARLDTPWNLYLMNPQDPKPSPILIDIQHPRSLAWSPNGEWLAFGGQPSFSTEGLWLFNPTSKALKQVTDKNISALAWSPDGHQIAAIFSVDESSRQTQVWRYDVSTLIASQ